MRACLLRTFGLFALLIVSASCGTAASLSPAPTPTAAALGNSSVSQITLVAQPTTTSFDSPLDATPDLQGSIIYFTAHGPHGSGVFRVSARGRAVSEVFSGLPFVTPRGIALSTDGKLLYIADPAAEHAGAIFVLALAGGPPTLLQGSQGTMPQNLDVVIQGGQQVIFFTGQAPGTNQPAVLQLPSSGASAPTVALKGSPLMTPDGIVVSASGTIYVSDRTAAGGSLGQVFKIAGTSIVTILKEVHLGNPAGIALSPDGSILLISAHQPTNGHAEVLLVNLSTLQTGSVTRVIGSNSGAGGLHASPGNKTSFAWAGSPVSRGQLTSGGVYLVQVVNCQGTGSCKSST